MLKVCSENELEKSMDQQIRTFRGHSWLRKQLGCYPSHQQHQHLFPSAKQKRYTQSRNNALERNHFLGLRLILFIYLLVSDAYSKFQLPCTPPSAAVFCLNYLSSRDRFLGEPLSVWYKSQLDQWLSCRQSYEQ